MDSDDDLMRSSTAVWLIAGAVTFVITTGFVISPASHIVSESAPAPTVAQAPAPVAPHAFGDAASLAASDALPEPDPSPNAIGLGLGLP